MSWIALKDRLPNGDQHCVLLFPCQTEMGVLYITSTPDYAIKWGIKHGYTHWKEIEMAPDHDVWEKWQIQKQQRGETHD